MTVSAPSKQDDGCSMPTFRAGLLRRSARILPLRVLHFPIPQRALRALCERPQRISGLSSLGSVWSEWTLRRAGLGVSASECRLGTPTSTREGAVLGSLSAGGGTSAVAQSHLHVAAGAASVSRNPIRVLGPWDLDVLIVLHLVAQLALETLRKAGCRGELSVLSPSIVQ